MKYREDLCGSKGSEAGQEEEVLGGGKHGDHWGLPNQRDTFYPCSSATVVADTSAFPQPLTDVWTSSPVRKSSLSWPAAKITQSKKQAHAQIHGISVFVCKVEFKVEWL